MSPARHLRTITADCGHAGRVTLPLARVALVCARIHARVLPRPARPTRPFGPICPFGPIPPLPQSTWRPSPARMQPRFGIIRAMCDAPDPYPVRKPMNHTPPFCVDAADAWYFITICAAERGGTPFTDHAAAILDAARHYHRAGKWVLSLFLIMPDHIHLLVHVPMVGGDVPAPRNAPRAAGDVRPYRGLAKTIGDFKSFLNKKHHLSFQRDFFDTRLRDDEHYAEKWRYIVRNPVTRGLVASPREWPHVIAFNRDTGDELPHR